MSALLTKFGSWFTSYVVKYVVRYVVDHFRAWVERRNQAEKQKKIDAEKKKKYDEAIANGTEAEIEQATTDLFSK